LEVWGAEKNHEGAGRMSLLLFSAHF